MNIKKQVEIFLKQYNLKNAFDQRTQHEIFHQKGIIERICKQNQQIFNIKLTEKKNKKYTSSKLIRVDLKNDWYCYITDNKVVSQQTVITLHGAPGNHMEWAGIETQMGGRVRWINLILPGFDGQDERRGSYTGSIEQIGELIMKLAQQLAISRITFCSHSYGSNIGLYVFGKYPELVEGYVNIGGVINHWFLGVTMMYKIIIAENKYYEDQWKSKKLFDIDQHREKMWKGYRQFYSSNQYERYRLPLLDKYQYFAWLKTAYVRPELYDEFFGRSRTSQRLKLLIFGKVDHFHQNEKIQLMFYDILYGKDSYLNQKYYRNLYQSIKKPVEERLLKEYGVRIEGDKIQQHLFFMFEETGHAVHRRRPEEISKILKIYLTALQVIHQHKDLLNSHL